MPKKNMTTYSKVDKSSASRSRPDPKPHVTKSSYGSDGKATWTHHYKGSSEYKTGKNIHR